MSCPGGQVEIIGICGRCVCNNAGSVQVHVGEGMKSERGKIIHGGMGVGWEIGSEACSVSAEKARGCGTVALRKFLN